MCSNKLHSGGGSIFQRIVKSSVVACHSHSFSLSAGWMCPTPQRWHPPSQASPSRLQNRMGSNFSFYLCVLIFISHIYGILLTVIIMLSGRLRSLSKRGRRAGRWCRSEAAILQRSLIISKAKMCKSHNKDKTQSFSSALPIARLLSAFSLSLSAGTSTVIPWLSGSSLHLFPSPSSRRQYLSLSLSGTIRRLIRLSWLFLDALCWWCSSTGEAGGWVAAIRTWQHFDLLGGFTKLRLVEGWRFRNVRERELG